MDEVRSLPISLLAFLIAAVHVFSFAVLSRRVLGIQFEHRVAESAYFGLGFALFGFYLWAIGHLHLLTRSWFLASSALILLAIRPTGEWARVISQVASGWKTALGRHRFLTLAVSGLVVVAVLSGLRSTQFDDDYKWQSATVWADAGAWVKVPYRLTNGTAMSEMFHVVGAVFGSTTAAHWTSTLLWVVALLNVATIARLLGVPVAVGAACALAIPAFTANASVLSSDIASAAFALSAFVFLLGATTKPLQVAAAAGVLLAGVLSAKFIGLACLPAAIILTWRRSAPVGEPRLRALAVTALVAPVCLCAVLWAAHTYHLTGRPYDDSGKYMARTPDDPWWRNGVAAGRIPSLRDLLRIPIEPWISTIWGQREPYGGRSGLLWAILAPLTLWLLWKRRLASTPALWVLLIAGSFYLLLSPVVLKTRFLLLFFLLMSALAAAAVEHRNKLNPRAAAVVFAVFVLTSGLGMLEGTRKLLFGVILEEAPATPLAQVHVADMGRQHQ